jgi:replicative DNA helicase
MHTLIADSMPTPTHLAAPLKGFLSKSTHAPQETTSHRLMPSSEVAEMGLLSLILFDPSRSGAICLDRKLTANHFQKPSHQEIYSTLLSSWINGTPHDLVTLTDALRSSGELKKVGGHAYLNEVSTTSMFPSQIGSYIEIIIRDFTRRQMIVICGDFTERAHDDNEDVQQVLTDMQTQVAAITMEPPKRRKAFQDILLDTISSIENGDPHKADIRSGIASLDAVVRMQRGNLIVIAGMAKAGKSALAGTIMLHALVEQGLRVVIISLEMNAEEIALRMISSIGGINLRAIGNSPTAHEMDKISRAADVLYSCVGRFEIVTDARELHPILAACRQLHKEKPLDLIILDYIQLVDSSGQRKNETRQEVVAQVSRSAKGLASELNCVVIGLSQLNDDGKLRESRAIGQDANALISVDATEGDGRILSIVAQRSGASGVDCEVDWMPTTTTFQTATGRSQKRTAGKRRK